MENLTSFDKRKKEWCLIYKQKYVLRVGTWYVVNKVIEYIPYPQRDEYRMLHISVCNNLIFVWPGCTKYGGKVF